MQVELKNVRVQPRGLKAPILDLKELMVPSGGALLVTGPSGAGKTTLLHVLAGLLTPDEGAVSLDKHPLNKLSAAQKTALRKELVGLIFQRLNLLEHLTALENVMLVLSGGKKDRAVAEKALDRLHLSHRTGTLAGNLSLGEQQRVAAARALVKNPKLILADEPTSSLDELNKKAVMEALWEANKRGATLLVVSHDTRLKDEFNHRLVLEPTGGHLG